MSNQVEAPVTADEALDRLIDDLSSDHPEHDRDRVQQLVQRSADRFNGARVTDFIPVLVRREVTDQLESRPSSPSST